MSSPLGRKRTIGRYALCVGVGTYTNLENRNLRYAAVDATAIAERLTDPQRGNFAVKVLTGPLQTTKAALDEAVEHLLSAPERHAEDLTLLYFSCHGDVYKPDNTFCLMPSNATQQAEGIFDSAALISIYDFARWFARARTQNIIVLLDVCHSGGAGAALQHFKLDLDAGPNFFIIGAARQDQVAMQSSTLEHGLFTHCLLRAFEQPPVKDGWLTVSQIQNFVSNEIPWFGSDQPTQIQSWSVSVNPNIPLLRNPGYPELCPLPPLWNVPFQRNDFFTGQEDLLSSLASMLHNEQEIALTQPHALSGLGGIGKTQLALEYAYRHRQDYHAVLWGRADTREALISTFVNIAHLLRLPQQDEEDQMLIVEAVKTWLIGRAEWLFILDNADELALVKEFIPPAFRGHLLLTTRAQTMGKFARKLEIEVMQPESGALLLLRRAGLLALKASLEQASGREVTIAKELVKDLGGLPLAIDQAGAYIEETQTRLIDYQNLYRMQRANLLKMRGGLIDDHPESVATTWSLSFQRVKENNAAAADLLLFCAHLAPDAISEEMLIRGAKHLGSALQKVVEDPFTLNQAIASLNAYSLISRNMAEKTVGLHRLVQAVLQDSLEVQAARDWKQRAVLVVKEASPNIEDIKQWYISEQWLPHALICATWIEQEQICRTESASILKRAGSFLKAHGQYIEAEPLLQRALAIVEQLFDTEHLDISDTLERLAGLYLTQGKYGEAEALYKRALYIKEQLLGTEHLETMNINSSLARLYHKQGNYKEAESLHLRVQVIYEKVLGPTDPVTAINLNFLALLYFSQGKYSEAKLLYQQVLTIFEQGLGASHPHVANTLSNLGEIYFIQGKYTEAEALVKRALLNYELVLGATHPTTVSCLNNLALLYNEQGKYTEAEPLFQRVLTITEQSLGASHPNLAIGLNNLAGLYRSQKKYAEAEALAKRALIICEQVLGATHHTLAMGLNNLAQIYSEQGKYEEAEPLFQRFLAITEQEFGATHPNLATGLRNLAGLYSEQGKYEEAEPLYRRALAIIEQEFGTTHPDLAIGLNNLALLYGKQGKYGEAEPLSQRALTIGEQVLGPTHPQTVTFLSNLATLYKEQEKYEEAETLYQRALSIREQQVEVDSPEIAADLFNLANFYRHWGKFEQAELLYKRVLAIDEQIHGSGHLEVGTDLDALAALYKGQEKYEEAEPLYQRVLVIREQALGATHPDTATSSNNLAICYYQQGKYTEAEPLFQRTLSIHEQQFGALHLITAQSLSNLAHCYYKQGKYKEAEPLYKGVLAIREREMESSHPDTFQILDILATLYRMQGKYKEAEPLYQRALSINEQQFDLIHPSTAINLYNLAYVYAMQDKYEEAEPLYQRALSINEQIYGLDHLEVATDLFDLAFVYKSQERYAEAEPLYKRALNIREQKLGITHSETMNILIALAEFYQNQRRYTEAEPLYQRALIIREEQLGNEHPATQIVRKNYTRLLAVMKWEEEGDEKWVMYTKQVRKVLTLSQEEAKLFHLNYIGTEHLLLGLVREKEGIAAKVLANLGVELNKVRSAVEFVIGHRNHIMQEEIGLSPRTQKVIELALNEAHLLNQDHIETEHLLLGLVREGEGIAAGILETLGVKLENVLTETIHELGGSQLDIARNLSGLANFYWSRGEEIEVETLYQRVLVMQERELGASHPEIAQNLTYLANLYHTQEKYEEAEMLLQRVLKIREQVLGASDPDTAQSLNNLASLYYDQGKYGKAELLYKRSLTIYENTLGQNHPSTYTTRTNYATLRRMMGRDA